jgi:hypothetical protein
MIGNDEVSDASSGGDVGETLGRDVRDVHAPGGQSAAPAMRATRAPGDGEPGPGVRDQD